ncbi:unnamed protein product [Hydatigera taeniaeformis]|uniref:AD domain-containing protein n=1 Tax=Hydatigena taeniaeformis TaxID=6205 RepID=A0A0R3X5R2_HYDTA|nr:unnamed protein product [Hydatigera taeniaeformis]
MDSRPPSSLPSLTLASDTVSGNVGGFTVRPPDKFNFDLSDLIDDLIALAYTDSASNTPDAGSGVVLSNLAQRIASLRASIQEAKELCRSSPRQQRTTSVTPGSSTVTAAPTPQAKATPATANTTDANQSLSLFQSACDLDPVAQQQMGLDAESLPPLWTAVRVRCCNSREFKGYLCGASDGSGGDSSSSNLVLCSIPEEKIIFICGWSIENVEVLPDYPPLPATIKSRLEEIYASVVKEKAEVGGFDSVDLRRQSVLRYFGPFAANEGEDGKIVLYDGVVTILPPYLPSSCQGTNPTVLQKVQSALTQIDEVSR